jgi:glycerol-3-phosphate acyltransferase PlsY
MEAKEVWPVVLAVVAGFLIGSVNPAMILARALGTDLRHAGSGNPGATNVGRVMGVRWGLVVGLADALKGFVPVLVTDRLLGQPAALAVGLAVVLGHIWSPFLRGSGGKGVATSFGAVLAVEPWFAVGLAALFALLLWRLRWVGGASIVAFVGLFLLGVAAWAGWLPGTTRLEGVWCAVLALVVISRHRGNIRRWVADHRH